MSSDLLINSTDSTATNRTYMGWKSGSSYGYTGLHLINMDNSSLVLGTNNTARAYFDVSGNFAVISPPGTYTLDTAPAKVAVANNGTVDFPNCSGMLIVNSWNNGWVTKFLCGGGSTNNVGQVGGTVGTLTYVSGIAGYRWTNNLGSSHTIGFMFFRTRDTA